MPDASFLIALLQAKADDDTDTVAEIVDILRGDPEEAEALLEEARGQVVPEVVGKSSKWDEAKHPRADDGKFGGGGGGGQPDEVIGKGSSGEVVKRGGEVHKNSTGHEAKVYAAIGGKEGVAAGREESGKIVTPHFANVLSVDTVPQGKRASYGPIVSRNLPAIVNAVSLLTEVGYDYNDPLQVGFDKSGKDAKVFDFSAAQKTSREVAMRENLDRLSTYLNEFGAGRHASGVSRARQVLDYIDPDSRALDSDSPEAVDGERIDARLDGKTPKYAYYAFNAREIPSVAQTEHRDGVKAIFSPVPLSDEFMRQWEIMPAIHTPT